VLKLRMLMIFYCDFGLADVKKRRGGGMKKKIHKLFKTGAIGRSAGWQR